MTKLIGCRFFICTLFAQDDKVDGVWAFLLLSLLLSPAEDAEGDGEGDDEPGEQNG
jgi:hypothetical protein